MAEPDAGPDREGLGAFGRWAIVAGFALLLLSMVSGVFVAGRARDAESWVTHTLEVRQAAIRLDSALAEAEAGARGYLLSQDASYLRPVEKAREELPRVTATLEAMTRDNPDQQARLSELKGLLTARMRVIEEAVEMRRQGKTTQSILAAFGQRGPNLANRARTLLNDLDAAEARLFAARERKATTQREQLVFVMLASTILAAALAGAILLAARRYARTLLAANAALKQEMHERASAEQQLRQAQKMEAIGRLTGGVAHDFNNMLAIVIGSLDMALQRFQGEARVRALMENALDAAKRGAALTQRLLAFSRQQPLNPKPIDANRSVAEISQLLTRTLGEAVVVETVLAAGLWRTLADPPQLESAILNLAVNARDAMPEGGKLTLETANAYLDAEYARLHEEAAPGQYVMIAVTDSGRGMDAETLSKAFDPFFTTKATGMGTGLGLSQVHGFVKQTGGHVKLYSEPEIGTTVKIYLPRLVAEAEAPGEPPAPPRPSPIDGHTILVVEDEDGVRDFIVEALRQLGYGVLEAAHAQSALETLAANPCVTVMLTDVVMPGMNGRQLADHALAAHPALKVVYMTGYTRNAIVHNGMLDRGANLLTKPFTVSQLESELRRMLAG